MLARCARCQGTFTTDHYGRQTCPHCGSELILTDPGAPAPAPEPPAADGPTSWGSPPPGGPGGGWAPPPPQGGGWAPPPGGGWVPPGCPGGGWPPQPPQEEPALASPFAERATRGFFRALFQTWKLVALEPQRFFLRVRTDQTGTAIFFGVLLTWVGGAVGAALGLVSNAAQMASLQQSLSTLPPDLQRLFERLLPLMTGGFVVAQIVLIPLFTILGMFVWAGVVHLFLLMFKGGGRGFQATLTVVAFSYGLDVFAAVPGCGGFIALIWQLVVMIIGLAAIHRADTWKSATAVLAPAILCCCCLLGVGGFATAALIGAKASGGGVSDL